MLEKEEQDQDHWHQLVAQKTDEPMKTYDELRAIVEEALSVETISIDDHPKRDWYRA